LASWQKSTKLNKSWHFVFGKKKEEIKRRKIQIFSSVGKIFNYSWQISKSSPQKNGLATPLHLSSHLNLDTPL